MPVNGNKILTGSDHKQKTMASKKRCGRPASKIRDFYEAVEGDSMNMLQCKCCFAVFCNPNSARMKAHFSTISSSRRASLLPTTVEKLVSIYVNLRLEKRLRAGVDDRVGFTYYAEEVTKQHDEQQRRESSCRVD